MKLCSKPSLFTSLLIFSALLLPAMAISASEIAQQAQTAAQHADYASRANNISQIRLHLHHVINCLVGPDSSEFDAEAGNPCKNQGNGALNAKNLSEEQEQTLRRALELAKVGVAIGNKQDAQNTAAAISKLLQQKL